MPMVAWSLWMLGAFWGYAAVKNLVRGGDWTDVVALVVVGLLWLTAFVLSKRDEKRST